MPTSKTTKIKPERSAKALIPTKVVNTTIITFIVVTLVFFHYDAYSNGLSVQQMNIGNLITTVCAPFAISILTAPVLGLVRNSTFIQEFKNALFFTGVAGICYILYLMVSGRGFGI